MKHTRATRAFSMVEVSIAILILAVAILPIFQVFISNSEETRANKNRSFAALLASSVLERFKRCSTTFLQDKFKDKIPDINTLDKMNFPGGNTGPEAVTKDALLAPTAGGGTAEPSDAFVKEYFDLTSSRFRRYCSFEPVNDPGSTGPSRIGKLTCTVVWTEKAAGITRILSYTLACLVVDPVQPGGS